VLTCARAFLQRVRVHDARTRQEQTLPPAEQIRQTGFGMAALTPSEFSEATAFDPFSMETDPGGHLSHSHTHHRACTDQAPPSRRELVLHPFLVRCGLTTCNARTCVCVQRRDLDTNRQWPRQCNDSPEQRGRGQHRSYSDDRLWSESIRCPRVTTARVVR
jgi:hypothetical protein